MNDENVNGTKDSQSADFNMGKLDKVQAWNIVAQVCALYKGTLQEHQLLQKALSLLQPSVEIN